MTTQRQYPGAPVNGGIDKASGQSGATTGVKRTLTTPTGMQAALRFATVVVTAGAATIAIQVVVGGVVITLASGTTTLTFNGSVNLDAGDQVRVNVTVLDAASLFDWYCGEDQYLAQ
jgi:hypothetical protein